MTFNLKSYKPSYQLSTTIKSVIRTSEYTAVIKTLIESIKFYTSPCYCYYSCRSSVSSLLHHIFFWHPPTIDFVYWTVFFITEDHHSWFPIIPLRFWWLLIFGKVVIYFVLERQYPPTTKLLLAHLQPISIPTKIYLARKHSAMRITTRRLSIPFSHALWSSSPFATSSHHLSSVRRSCFALPRNKHAFG